MKKERFLNAVVGCAVCLLFIVCFVWFSYIESHYTRKGEIVELDECMDIVVIEDTTGNLWECFDDTEKFNVGDKVIVKMFTNYTDDKIEDDEIIFPIKVIEKK